MGAKREKCGEPVPSREVKFHLATSLPVGESLQRKPILVQFGEAHSDGKSLVPVGNHIPVTGVHSVLNTDSAYARVSIQMSSTVIIPVFLVCRGKKFVVFTSFPPRASNCVGAAFPSLRAPECDSRILSKERHYFRCFFFKKAFVHLFRAMHYRAQYVRVEGTQK